MTDNTKFPPEKNQPAGYVPPKIWTWERESGGVFAGINRPIAGARHDSELPIGEHPHQLYSLATPNGMKVSIIFEELLAAGFAGAEYDAWFIDIGKGDQFGSGFVDVNPNSKIPALVDRQPRLDSGKQSEPVRVFESGSILFYLAEKFGAFLPQDVPGRTATLNWLMWQMGAGPLLGGGFGHFYAYAPLKIEYAIDRFAMEVKRQLDVLDRHLTTHHYMAGDSYTIADMAIWPWYGRLALDQIYADAGTFLSVEEYQHLQRWARLIAARPAVQRGILVNRMDGVKERHSAADFA
ncbi:glutathione-dependent disulfide-bond oxidoreductase [Pelovirga terrestris]|uniref:Glutathione-dependent disulfide-bond oxidoreductase n=1 Tax=Pelovirga terrestris TaxID=2771352 RepID=A0A8J6UH45_9BACT|nr:glutathione-dependent disulfide-bond oxidoreductase [Pelovirga terrestris]MBD1400903.1 glutathione-dependent disulfide-bond oxidoreductase [Pelovirga terrestris]